MINSFLRSKHSWRHDRGNEETSQFPHRIRYKVDCAGEKSHYEKKKNIQNIRITQNGAPFNFPQSASFAARCRSVINLYSVWLLEPHGILCNTHSCGCNNPGSESSKSSEVCSRVRHLPHEFVSPRYAERQIFTFCTRKVLLMNNLK